MGRYKRSTRWNTVVILAAGFMGVILAGAVLLSLPICNRRPIAFEDALFTSTTAVCVTGLVTVNPAAQFTFLGKIILLLLIQIGGLGVIGCATLFFLLLRRQITVRERVVLHETYNSESIGGIVGFVRKVIIGTFVVEGAGALGYAFQFVPEFGLARGLWYSVFHSVSAFCNAGIDILGENSLADYVANPIINITTMLLIILSGLGFTVWYDLIKQTRRFRRREVPGRRWFFRLRLHSKLVIIMTAVLILGGAISFLVMEYNNPDTLGSLSIGNKIMASFFQSVTTRTAGFFTISQEALHGESKFLGCIMMFIGGSPGGTAGGVKTTTFAMLILVCITVMKGGNDTECFGKKITYGNFRTGFAVVMVSLATFIIGTLLIASIEPDRIQMIDIMYETASAVGTVGLTAGLTEALSGASHMVLIILMYMGRLGPMSLALVFIGKSHPRDRIRELPEERIMIG